MDSVGVNLKKYCIKFYRQPKIGLLVIGLFMFAACGKKKQEEFPKIQKKEFPAIEMRDSVVIDMYEGSRISWVLKTDYMKKAMNNNILLAKPINMVLFDSSGGEAAWITADSGAADEDMSFVNIWGHVYAKARDGASVKTDSLVWEKKTSQITTDGKVKVVSEEGDTLTGIGFISDDKLENWKILANVRTVIPKLEERIDKQDEEAIKEKE